MTFPFLFDPVHRTFALLFGITPDNARVEVADGHLLARYGPWSVRTPLTNVASTVVTGPYSSVKTIGPGRMSMVDRGLTFASNGSRGLCICFHEPVPGLEPTGRLRHPGLTVTVADIDGLAAALNSPAPPA
ncbi:MAG: hypothetical protein M3066_03485 [Actinomycetota bacterium]|nr:hypothetical protein [Actinomycetota bacterium]